MLSKINGGGHEQCYVLPTIVCATTNNDLPMEDRYSVLIFQHALANIINISQRFIKLLHQPIKPYGLAGQFLNIPKGNKEAYYSIDDFLHRFR